MRLTLKAIFFFSVPLFWFHSAQAADAFFDTEHFSGSGNCALCHNGLFDSNGNDVSLESEWSATMMANATRDPLWRAKFATEIQRHPQHDALLSDKCTRCHAPMANQQSVFDGIAPQFFGLGFSDLDSPYHNAAMDGVSCTLCHQIADVNLGTGAGESGQYRIVDYVDPFDRPAYGPYTNPRINPMRINAVFTPRYSPHVLDSALCATCHNLKTPVLNDLGDLTDGKFPEQMVYSEWENSDFADGGAEANTCQQCHMARANGVKIANRPRTLAPRDNFARHGFYGGNTLLLDILDANRAELDVGNGDFAAAIEATRATLRSAADLVIKSTVVQETAPGERDLVVSVRVDNNSGHKLPTSYPSRRAYLHLTVADQNGAILFESGRLDTDTDGKPTGAIVGVEADTDAGYEPHYSGEITSASQVQVYEAIMEDISGNQTYTLLDAARYSKDNRLLPRGFPTGPDDRELIGSWDDIGVVGEALGDDDFLPGSDLVTYRIPLAADTSAVTVSADLNYQTVAYGYLLDLFADRAIQEVADFERMYETSDVRYETIASTFAAVDVGNGGGTPVNQPPVASFTFGCTNLACSFNGTGSTDDGTIVGYAWDFGDGATATGAQVSHTFAAAGTYTVTLTVTDDGGLAGSAEQTVTASSVVNQTPVASFTVACTELACTFNGTGSTDDGTIVAYAWNFGDGATATGATTSHTYAAAGTYSVTLTVTDDGGLTGSASRGVTVAINTGGPGPGPGGPRRR